MAELRGRLVEKGYSEGVVSSVCARLCALGYLDDRQFATSLLKSFSGNRCRSSWVIQRELCRRGIEPALACEVVEKWHREEEVFNAACALVRQRSRGCAVRDGDKTRARMHNLLLRRGFDRDFIHRVMAEALPVRGDEAPGE
ncbi:MAG: regulatory protein RecX [Candidatus Aureabacteria bacterium]|nr:regulatory protein RecX [Candidatus Auribacterota bacterium]